MGVKARKLYYKGCGIMIHINRLNGHAVKALAHTPKSRWVLVWDIRKGSTYGILKQDFKDDYVPMDKFHTLPICIQRKLAEG